MHEMGIALNIVDRIEYHAKAAGAKKVRNVILRIGNVSGIETDYLDKCWEHACEDTILEGANFEYDIVKGILKCKTCGAEYDALEAIMQDEVRCPECDSPEFEVLSGQEMEILNITVEG